MISNEQKEKVFATIKKIVDAGGNVISNEEWQD